jgi:hypothetical protein
MFTHSFRSVMCYTNTLNEFLFVHVSIHMSIHCHITDFYLCMFYSVKIMYEVLNSCVCNDIALHSES